jgi:hypothetical protein
MVEVFDFQNLMSASGPDLKLAGAWTRVDLSTSLLYVRNQLRRYLVLVLILHNTAAQSSSKLDASHHY